MSTPLLTLGTFSFDGFELPQQIRLESNQRLAVHHLGSGLSTIDCLGEDCEIVSFRGTFSGTNVAERIRSIDFLRVQGRPLRLAWGSQALLVLIYKFDLNYSSTLWVPYELSCLVVRSSNPSVLNELDTLFTSAATQVGDVLGLLQSIGATLSSEQATALTTLAGLNYDIPPQGALAITQSLISSISEQITALGNTLDTGNLASPDPPARLAPWPDDCVANAGLEATLILARNRLSSAIISAESVSE